jgi:hypothetical protein
MEQKQPTVIRISEALRVLVAAIYLDATGQPYEGQYETEIQGLSNVLAEITVYHSLLGL